MDRCTGKQQIAIVGTPEDILALWSELERYAADGTWSVASLNTPPPAPSASLTSQVRQP
jgi:hypothetical protein